MTLKGYKPNRFALLPKVCSNCGKHFTLEGYRKIDTGPRRLVCSTCLDAFRIDYERY